MFSSRSLGLAALCLGALLPVLACGKKGDPMPAPRTIPKAATDLTIRQRGLEVVLEFAYPNSTVAGLPLPPIDSVTVLELDRPIAPPPPAVATSPAAVSAPGAGTTGTTPGLADGGSARVEGAASSTTGAPAASAAAAVQPPELAGAKAAEGSLAPLAQTPSPAPALALPDAREFALAAKPMLTLTGGELASAISGDRVTTRFRLAEPLPATPSSARFFAVRTHATGGEESGLSNLAGFVPRTPPPPPSEFLAVAAKDGVELSWHAAPAPGQGAPSAPPVLGFHVYRRDAARTSYGAPIASVEATAQSHADRTAVYGRRYIYAVTALASREPLAESALSSEREIDYQDRFAPLPPPSLSALGSVGEVRLVWEASPDPDVAGYLLERADPEADFHRVNTTPVTELEFTDRGLASGFDFRYRVAAIDTSGNLGAFGEPATTRVP